MAEDFARRMNVNAAQVPGTRKSRPLCCTAAKHQAIRMGVG
ncbi:hypothetical protein [Thermoclostridium caenicola]|nr:hypothetical protein [Thermoclostridium caenicola]